MLHHILYFIIDNSILRVMATVTTQGFKRPKANKKYEIFFKLIK